MACKGCEARRRFLIAGVTSAATVVHAKYLKPAREFLESVKQQAGFGGLQQLSQQYTNEEGVKLTASSRFGQDEMVIDVPGGKKEKEVVIRRPRVLGPQMIICGKSDVFGWMDGDWPMYDPHAWQWTPATGMVDLGTLSGDVRSGAEEVSNDGRITVGWSSDEDILTLQAVYWKNGDPATITGLGQLEGNVDPASEAWAVSANGNVIVGDAYVGSPATARAFRWTKDTGMVSLGLLPDGTNSNAYGVSTTGKTICGVCYLSTGPLSVAFRWTEEEGMVSLGILGTGYSDAKAISDDGKTIVGIAAPAPAALRAFRWRQETGMVSLGVPTGMAQSVAFAVSGDGSVVVGDSTPPSPGGAARAFRWTEATGIVALPVLPGWAWTSCNGVSQDGKVITGWWGPGATAGIYPASVFRWSEAEGMVDMGNLPGVPDDRKSARGRDVTVFTLYEECNGAIKSADGDLNFDQLVAMDLIPESCSPEDLDE